MGGAACSRVRLRQDARANAGATATQRSGAPSQLSGRTHRLGSGCSGALTSSELRVIRPQTVVEVCWARRARRAWGARERAPRYVRSLSPSPLTRATRAAASSRRCAMFLRAASARFTLVVPCRCLPGSVPAARHCAWSCTHPIMMDRWRCQARGGGNELGLGGGCQRGSSLALMSCAPATLVPEHAHHLSFHHSFISCLQWGWPHQRGVGKVCRETVFLLPRGVKARVLPSRFARSRKAAQRPATTPSIVPQSGGAGSCVWRPGRPATVGLIGRPNPRPPPVLPPGAATPSLHIRNGTCDTDPQETA